MSPSSNQSVPLNPRKYPRVTVDPICTNERRFPLHHAPKRTVALRETFFFFFLFKRKSQAVSGTFWFQSHQDTVGQNVQSFFSQSIEQKVRDTRGYISSPDT